MAFDVRYELLTTRELRRLGAFFTESGSHWQQADAGYGLIVLDTTDGPSANAVAGAHPDILLAQRKTVVLRVPMGRPL